ncbi:hypothetical protein TNCV_747032, partial [Trichonephila clavipes]
SASFDALAPKLGWWHRLAGWPSFPLSHLAPLAPWAPVWGESVPHVPKAIYEFFAMDGYQGDDPKKYVELFRFDTEDARGKHVRAVRLLYRQEVVNTPQSIFDETCTDTEYKDMYVEHVQGQVADMAEWRREQLDKTKKKRPAEEDAREAKKVATED